MEFQKLVLIVTLLLVAVAVFLTLTAEQPVVEDPTDEGPDTEAAQELLMKGLEFGKGQTEYYYRYSDLSDGYKITYTLTRKGNGSSVGIENPLSAKMVYFLENDTVLCVDYRDEVCSSVEGVGELDNYLESLRVKFFDDERITKDKVSMKALIDKGYVTLDPEIRSGTSCDYVSYTLDFTGISLQEAALYGIGSDSPKLFSFSMCVSNSTGYVHSKAFNYTYKGVPHDSVQTLISFQTSAPDIEAPQNVSPGAVAELREEREQTIKLAKCFTDKQGDERDKCISLLALNLKREDVCEMAGARRDRCLVSLVPLVKDESICPRIADAGFKDDCYIELAGAFKNESYCGMVMNQSKTEQCANAAKPKEDEPDDFQINIDDFLDYVESYNDSNATPYYQTDPGNGSG